jgi:PhnB protein
MAVSPVPAGYHSVTPYLFIDGAARALPWYVQVFDGRELMRLSAPQGKIGHAEIEIGDSRVMMADESAEFEARSPASFGGSPVSLHVYVPDVDATVARAVAAGAEVKSPVQDKFYGDRAATLLDPFGHTWHVATHTEDVAPDEIERRLAELYSKS